MPPYSEGVLHQGQLLVWSNEWEVYWCNDHPQTMSGAHDARYSYSGTKLTRDRLIDLANGISDAWEAAAAAAITLRGSGGSFFKPFRVWPVTVGVMNGAPVVKIKDMCAVHSAESALSLAERLQALVVHADSKLVDVARLFGREPAATQDVAR